MDDLIILIIRAIARMLNTQAPQIPPRRVTGAPPVAPPPKVLRRIPGRRPGAAPVPAGRRAVAPVRPAAAVAVEDKIAPGGAGSHTILNPVTKSADASVSIRALLTPSMLRRQFILTEILQPPMALREPR
jgi:hypothetical protein